MFNRAGRNMRVISLKVKVYILILFCLSILLSTDVKILQLFFSSTCQFSTTNLPNVLDIENNSHHHKS